VKSSEEEVSLREITRETLRPILGLEVGEHQRQDHAVVAGAREAAAAATREFPNVP
jgi:hypothetical protein